MISEKLLNEYYIVQKSEPITDKTEFHAWQLLKSFIGKNVYWQNFNSGQREDLPKGYSAYIVKTEGPELEWLIDQAKKLDSHIFVINGMVNNYGCCDKIENLHWLPWVEIHYQTEQMLKDYDHKVNKDIQKKISCLSRMTKLNKMVALYSVLKYHNKDSITSFHNTSYAGCTDYNNRPTGHEQFDAILKEIPFYVNQEQVWHDLPSQADRQIDYIKATHDFHIDSYQKVAVNVTNESFCRSGLYNASTDDMISLPGPFITEKTLKCLLGETAFIVSGQRDTYSTLERLGFQFNYGFDLEYDKIFGDLDRMVEMHNVIRQLAQEDKHDIFVSTRQSCLSNKEHIISRKFYNICEKINEQTINEIHNICNY